MLDSIVLLSILFWGDEVCLCACLYACIHTLFYHLVSRQGETIEEVKDIIFQMDIPIRCQQFACKELIFMDFEALRVYVMH